MSYIQPNSTVRLIKNCPLSSDYEHTLYFDNTTSQFNYFNSLSGYTLNSQMYTRVDKGIFRCSLPMANVYDCNYMMFKNTSFENFWFYAFIDKIEYLNNGVSEIYFTIDVMQTWFIQKLTLGKCYVDREHSETDNIGDHIEPERMSVGEYKVNFYGELAKGDASSYDMVTQFAVIVAIVDTSADVGSNGRLYDGVYGGATLYCYRQGDKEGINAKINEYVNANKSDAIVAIYLTPQYLVEPYLDTHEISQTLKGRSLPYTLSAITTNDTLDGYKPKNNKLYTYPYNFLQVDNGNGASLTLRYEFFKDLTPVLRWSGCIVPPIQLMVRPKYYKNDGVELLKSETLTISNFPVCSWNYDSYQAWCAQSGVQAQRLVSNTLQGALNGAIYGGAFGASAFTATTGALTNAIGTGLDILAQDYQASIKADTLGGNFSSGNANMSQGELGFNVGRFSVSSNVAKRIDDFFSAYGYSCGRLKVPNINSRPHWNFVKTANCELSGSAPNDDITKVKQIFNNGITFWKNASEMYNYDLDNSPS